MRTRKQIAASRANALKFGIYAKTPVIFDESPQDLVDLTAEFQERYHSATPTECSLVDTLSNSEWRQRRLLASEAALWEHNANRILDDGQVIRVTTSAAFASDPERFARCQEITSHFERAHQRALAELRRLRVEP